MPVMHRIRSISCRPFYWQVGACRAYQLLLFVAALLCATNASALSDDTHDVAMSHAVPISLPDCDPNDPEVKFIRNDADWQEINDARFRVFCVEPGDYRRPERIVLNQSGTEDRPRVLRWFDPANPSALTPPWRQRADRQAKIFYLYLQNTRWWVIWGLSIERNDQEQGLLLLGDASRNVFSSVLFDDAHVYLYFGNQHNVIQKSVLRNTERVPDQDRHCITINGRRTPQHFNAFVENEIYNCAGDGLQIYGTIGVGDSDVTGTTIVNNDFYITPAMYTDCAGNLDPDGDCACAENGIDIKTTARHQTYGEEVSAARWTTIANNRFWGFRETDVACAGTGSFGSGIMLHGWDTRYLLIKNNVFLDGPVGITTAHQANHVSIYQNLFNGLDRSLNLWLGQDVEIYSNTFSDNSNHMGVSRNPDGPTNLDYRDNLHRNVGNLHSVTWLDLDADYNAYYGPSNINQIGPHSLKFEDAADAQLSDYCFVRSRLLDPEPYCIAKVRSTAASPHAGGGDPQLGSLRDERGGNIGVDNLDRASGGRYDTDFDGTTRAEPATIGALSVLSPPTLSISDASVSENDGSVTALMRLSAPSQQPVRVSVHTRAGSAKGGRDYYGFTREFQFQPGQIELPIAVAIVDDSIEESTEQFQLRLFRESGATIVDRTANITIEDDDSSGRTPIININADVTLRETNPGGTINVRLTEPAGRLVRFGVYTESVSATPGQDYYGFWREMEIQPGATSRQIAFTILDDTAVESMESFRIHIVRVENAVPGRLSTEVFIEDDD